MQEKKPPKAWMENHVFRLARSIREVKEFLEKGDHKEIISFDVEATSLDPWTCEVVGVSVSWDSKEAMYIPMAHVTGKSLNLPPEEVWAILGPVLQRKTVMVFNWQYEGHILPRFGVRTDRFKDIEPTVWLENMDDKEHGLKYSAEKHLKIDMVEIHEVPGVAVKEGRGKAAIHFEMSHPEDAYWYAASDVLCTYMLWEQLEEKVAAEQGPEGFILKLENNLVGVVVQMTENMLQVNRKFMQQAMQDATKWQSVVKKRFLQWIKKKDDEIELDSPKQLGEALTAIGVVLPKTDKGNLATSQKALAEKRRDDKQFDEKMGLLDLFRSLGKDRTTYMARMLESTSDEAPYIRVKINTCGAPTGRMSSGGADEEGGYAKLNAQAIPAPDDMLELDCMLVKNPGEKEPGPLMEG